MRVCHLQLTLHAFGNKFARHFSRNRSACRSRAKSPGMPLKSPSAIPPFNIMMRACKPGSVPPARQSLVSGSGHLSRRHVAMPLKRPYREGIWRAASACAPSAGLAPGGVYLAGRSPCRRWALTPPLHLCSGIAPRAVFISVALS